MVFARETPAWRKETSFMERERLDLQFKVNILCGECSPTT